MARPRRCGQMHVRLTTDWYHSNTPNTVGQVSVVPGSHFVPPGTPAPGAVSHELKDPGANTTMSPTTKPVTIRARSGLWITAAIAVLLASLAVDAVVRGALAAALAALPWQVLALWVVYLLTVRPRIVIAPDALTIVNAARIHRLPWNSIDYVTSRFQLAVWLLDGRRIVSWGAPSLGIDRALVSAGDGGDGSEAAAAAAAAGASGSAATIGTAGGGQGGSGSSLSGRAAGPHGATLRGPLDMRAAGMRTLHASRANSLPVSRIIEKAHEKWSAALDASLPESRWDFPAVWITGSLVAWCAVTVVAVANQR